MELNERGKQKLSRYRCPAREHSTQSCIWTQYLLQAQNKGTFDSYGRWSQTTQSPLTTRAVSHKLRTCCHGFKSSPPSLDLPLLQTNYSVTLCIHLSGDVFPPQVLKQHNMAHIHHGNLQSVIIFSSVFAGPLCDFNYVTLSCSFLSKLCDCDNSYIYIYLFLYIYIYIYIYIQHTGGTKNKQGFEISPF